MIYLFWLSTFGITLAYAGYPVILWLVAPIFKRNINKGEIFPHVSVLISAYNEEDSIRATLENKLGLDYPPDKMEIIVISDGSTDATETIVSDYLDQGVRLLVQNPRQGKTAALNGAVLEAKGEILIFSDANSIYQKDALKKIVSNFNDPTIGYVTGKMVYVHKNGTLVGSGCSAYMRYENALRSLESGLGSVVGVNGGIDAVRKNLYEPMRPDLLPDFVLPLKVIENGYRVIYENQALLMEQTLDSIHDELKMRIRVILRSFHALHFMRRLFNPFRNGFFSFQLFTHKLLRYLVGVLQITALIGNFFLVRQHAFYAWAFAAQLAFYLFGLCGYLSKNRSNKVPLFTYSYYLCLLNAASLVAFWKYLTGEKQVIWQPRKGQTL